MVSPATKPDRGDSARYRGRDSGPDSGGVSSMQLAGDPPWDRAAEQAVLGSMMMSDQVVDDVTQILTGAEFYQPAHETIWHAIVACQHTPDPISVADELRRRGQLAHVGGAVVLHDLISAVTVPANATHYAEIVRGHALRRRVIAAGIKITQYGMQGVGSAEQLSDEAQRIVFDATDSGRDEKVTPLGSLLEPAVDRIQTAKTRPSGLSTGFTDVDRLLSGMRPGQMIIVAARPGVGKSTFAVDVTRSVAIDQGTPALFVSLEMGSEELIDRILAAESSIPLSSIREGELSDHQWQKMADTLTRIQSAPLYLEDSTASAVTAIRSMARKMQRRGGLGLLVIDYIQLLSSGKRVESRQVEVSEFSRQIKLLAKELQIPVLALSQLNRASEQRTNKKPYLSDLRESGSLEQDADVVLLLHRDDLADPDSPRQGEADVIVAKNRNGETGTASLVFQGRYSRFVNMAGM